MLGRYIHIYEESATTLPRTPEAAPAKLFFRFQPVENGGEMWGPPEPAGLTSMNVHAG